MFIGSIAAISFFESIRRIPLSIVYVIMNMKGIFVLIMTILFLDDKITLKAFICISICFFGTIMLVKPSLLFSISAPEDSQISAQTKSSDFVYFLGCGFALICCLMKVGVSIWIRKFSKCFWNKCKMDNFRIEHFPDASFVYLFDFSFDYYGYFFNNYRF